MKRIDYAAHPDLAADARALDRSLRPVVNAILARIGLTRAQVLADDYIPATVVNPHFTDSALSLDLLAAAHALAAAPGADGAGEGA